MDSNPIGLVPPLPDVQYSLPEAFGRLMEATLLPNNALRRTSNSWTRWSNQQLFKLGNVVRPLRAVKERERYAAAIAARSAANAAAAPEDGSSQGDSSEESDAWDDDDGMWE